ncbi:MAG: hypothetical protein WBF08_10505, partial [Candidatus Bathyarchaeia archaeon]
MIDQDQFNLCQKYYAALDWKIIKKTRVGHILLTFMLILIICGVFYFFVHLTAFRPETLWRIDYEKSVIRNMPDSDEYVDQSFDKPNIVVEVIDGDT